MHRAKRERTACCAVALSFVVISGITLLLKLALISISGNMLILQATPNSTGSQADITQAADGARNPRLRVVDDPSAHGTFSVQKSAPAKADLRSTDKPRAAAVGGSMKAASILLLYLYAPSDRFYHGNLEYFIKHGIKESDGVDYIIIVQKFDGVKTTLAGLPALPANARYSLHVNECFDWGAYAWALNASTGLVDSTKYKYFMFVNSSVRGPFLPAYWPASIHWTTAFTSRLTASVKLVGSSISCGRIHRHNNQTQPYRSNPHVQSYAMATDQVGLEVLRKDGNILKCHSSILDTIWDAEIGASAAILSADYNLDCLLTKYQGVNWRNNSFANCNKGMNTIWEGHYDGINLNPLEQMFVKVNSMCLDEGLCSTTAAMALTYDKFVSEKGHTQNVVENAPLDTAKIRLDMDSLQPEMGEKNLTAGLQGCFDVTSYLKSNTDLQKLGTEGASAHFAEHGRFELQREWHIKSTPNCSISLVIDKANKYAMATFSQQNI